LKHRDRGGARDRAIDRAAIGRGELGVVGRADKFPLSVIASACPCAMQDAPLGRVMVIVELAATGAMISSWRVVQPTVVLTV
jgi:hypothetical protein